MAAGRAGAGDLTDDVAAYTVGLLPKDLLQRAGLSLQVREPGTDVPVALGQGFLAVRPNSDVAPAELAAGIVFDATLVQLSNHMSIDPTNAADLEFIRTASMTTALDTYIKLAWTHPESTQGRHFPVDDLVGKARLRLAGTLDEDRDEIDVEGQQQPALYLSELSNFFGHAYYRQTRSYVYQTHVPLPDDEAELLLRSLTERCG